MNKIKTLTVAVIHSTFPRQLNIILFFKNSRIGCKIAILT
jgi:hypothetical protein